MSGYIQGTSRQVTATSNALNKWLKRDFGSLPTAHSLRHTFRDRLRAVECPMDMIDQIGGWRSVGGVGAGYGEGRQFRKNYFLTRLINLFFDY